MNSDDWNRRFIAATNDMDEHMSNRDRTGNEINTFGIPTGPIDQEPSAAYHDSGEFKGHDAQEAILRDSLLRAGVELGQHDDRIVRWLAQLADWPTFATITSWIDRAADKESTR